MLNEVLLVDENLIRFQVNMFLLEVDKIILSLLKILLFQEDEVREGLVIRFLLLIALLLESVPM